MNLPIAEASLMQRMIGDWRIAMSTWSAEGVVTRSENVTARKEWFAGRRYVKETIAGVFAGSPHEKLTLLGYNQTRCRFEYLTADNHDGVLLLYASPAVTEPLTEKLEMIADYAAPDEAGDGPAAFVTIRTVISADSDDTHLLQNYYRPGSKPERLFLEYRYSRQTP